MWKPVHDMLSNLGYTQIIILMTLESTVFPVPSELVVPPAAYRAFHGELNIILVVLCSTLGSLIGATINYLLGLLLGRKIIYYLAETRIARLMFINKAKIIKAEMYFNKYGKSSTFIGRLVPGIRHLISIPAGISGMPFIPFAFYTALGAFVWTSVLAVLGYWVGANIPLLTFYYKQISYVLIVVFILFIIYLGIKTLSKKRKNQTTP
jgi:membrane protein DedA with SNARE-associated domain